MSTGLLSEHGISFFICECCHFYPCAFSISQVRFLRWGLWWLQISFVSMDECGLQSQGIILLFYRLVEQIVEPEFKFWEGMLEIAGCLWNCWRTWGWMVFFDFQHHVSAWSEGLFMVLPALPGSAGCLGAIWSQELKKPNPQFSHHQVSVLGAVLHVATFQECATEWKLKTPVDVG